MDAGVRNRPVDPRNPAALREAVAAALRGDKGLETLLTTVIRYSPTVFDISIADWNGQTLLSTDVGQEDRPVPRVQTLPTSAKVA